MTVRICLLLYQQVQLRQDKEMRGKTIIFADDEAIELENY